MKTLIIHKIFKSDPITVLNVINYGDENNGKITYETSEGVQCKTEQEINNSSTSVCSFEDIDLKSSLYQWLKSNTHQYGKKIVIDYSLTTGEVVKQYCWTISLMIATDDNSIYVKPIYN